MLIAGAAGRDFHNFNLVYRGSEEYEVVAFTATQIPNIDGRVYPAELAGSLYPEGIPILPETRARGARPRARGRRGRLRLLRRDARARDARRLARARGRRVLPPDLAARHDAHLDEAGRRRLRRPNGLGQEPDDAPHRGAPARRRQARRRPAPPDALRRPDEAGGAALRALRGPRRGRRTIEEREEYEPHLAEGNLVFAGIDYARDPRPGRAGGRRHPLGRRQQRHAVHQAERPRRRRRPAPPRATSCATTRARRTCAWRTSAW